MVGRSCCITIAFHSLALGGGDSKKMVGSSLVCGALFVGDTTWAFRKLRIRQHVFGKVFGNRFSIITINLS